MAFHVVPRQRKSWACTHLVLASAVAASIAAGQQSASAHIPAHVLNQDQVVALALGDTALLLGSKNEHLLWLVREPTAADPARVRVLSQTMPGQYYLGDWHPGVVSVFVNGSGDNLLYALDRDSFTLQSTHRSPSPSGLRYSAVREFSSGSVIYFPDRGFGDPGEEVEIRAFDEQTGRSWAHGPVFVERKGLSVTLDGQKLVFSPPAYRSAVDSSATFDVSPHGTMLAVVKRTLSVDGTVALRTELLDTTLQVTAVHVVRRPVVRSTPAVRRALVESALTYVVRAFEFDSVEARSAVERAMPRVDLVSPFGDVLIGDRSVVIAPSEVGLAAERRAVAFEIRGDECQWHVPPGHLIVAVGTRTFWAIEKEPGGLAVWRQQLCSNI